MSRTIKKSNNSKICKDILILKYPDTSVENWKRVRRLVRDGYTIRVFNDTKNGRLATVFFNSEDGFDIKNGDVCRIVNYTGLIEDQLRDAASHICHCGDYGHLYWNPLKKTVWWCAGDADGDTESGYTSLKDVIKILTIPGVAEVLIGAEYSPPDSAGYHCLGRYGVEI